MAVMPALSRRPRRHDFKIIPHRPRHCDSQPRLRHLQCHLAKPPIGGETVGPPAAPTVRNNASPCRSWNPSAVRRRSRCSWRVATTTCRCLIRCAVCRSLVHVTVLLYVQERDFPGHHRQAAEAAKSSSKQEYQMNRSACKIRLVYVPRHKIQEQQKKRLTSKPPGHPSQNVHSALSSKSCDSFVVLCSTSRRPPSTPGPRRPPIEATNKIPPTCTNTKSRCRFSDINHKRRFKKLPNQPSPLQIVLFFVFVGGGSASVCAPWHKYINIHTYIHAPT